ncbi:zinc-binding dehydrogenase [Peribacillus aracenensis]|uniref:zinc-binding dehydrogenase n=1 Tax=Peribacillus aracenensis TaxID=2976708 RepID=UPI0021A49254|nr:zinc-binding dehydrogenase [Peribacillus sp. BBB004]
MTLPKTCKAAVVTEYGAPIEVRDVKMPETLEPGAMLVKIDVASICGSDVHQWEGRLGLPLEFPFILGHEMVGIIKAFGEGVTHDSIGQELKIGDRILFTHASCGRCETCRVLKMPNACKNRKYYMMQSSEKYPYLTGGFAEYCYVFPLSPSVKIPDGVKSEWASGASCAFRTVVDGFVRIDRIGGMNWNDTLVIQGSGPLGLYATAIASTKGPKDIIVIGAPDKRLEIAKEWGATHIISIDQHPDPADRQKVIMELTNGKGADVLIEASGAIGAFVEGMGILANNGRYIVLGQVGGPEVPFAADLITKKNATIIGMLSADIDAYYKALRFIEQYRDRFDFDLMFSNTYKLNQINLAIEKMREFEEIKPLIKPY